MEKDYFGFLSHRWTMEFDGGKMSPISEFNEAAAWVDKYINEDGFLYPPIEHRIEMDFVTMKPLKNVPKTERPALLHRIPPSHELCLFGSGTLEDIRRGRGSFIIQLLGYLFGVRLQFYNWWFDSRVPIQEKARTHNIRFSKSTAEDFISHCHRTWENWSDQEQKLITNVLYMHCRAPSYEWDWEQFIIEYMVLDGCFKLARLLGVVQKELSHGKRIEYLCQAFDVPINDDLTRRIVRLRNKLFHETLWDGSQPCTAVSSSAFMLPYHLRRLNQRFIPALLGYKTPYIQSGWWSLGSFLFDQPS